MKTKLFATLAAAALLICGPVSSSFAQEQPPAGQPYDFDGPAVDTNQAMYESAAGMTLPMWQRNNVQTFSNYASTGIYNCTDPNRCSIVPSLILLGRDPAVAGPPPNNVTQIPTTIVPLILKFLDADGRTVRYTFDAFNNSACAGNKSPTTLTMQSPLFTDTPIQAPYWKPFYDQPNQATQFVDAAMRSEFYSWMSAQNPWHNKFHVTVAAPVTRNVPRRYWGTRRPAQGGCGALGAVDEKNWLDPVLRNIANTFGPNQFVFFITYNLIEFDTNGDDFLGYHNAYGNPPQVYAIAPFDTSLRYGMSDVSVMAHELGETMNNPLVTTNGNATPGWNINRGTGGRVSCQGNFEVGDPARILVGVNGHQITMNGFTYHLQEIAFAGWFYRISGLGIPWPGKPAPAYSTNGTFTTDAGTTCAPPF